MVKSSVRKGKSIEVILPQEEAMPVKKNKLDSVEVAKDSILSEKYAANYGLKELRALCKQNSIRGYSKMNKAQLAALFL